MSSEAPRMPEGIDKSSVSPVARILGNLPSGDTPKPSGSKEKEEKENFSPGHERDPELEGSTWSAEDVGTLGFLVLPRIIVSESHSR